MLESLRIKNFLCDPSSAENLFTTAALIRLAGAMDARLILANSSELPGVELDSLKKGPIAVVGVSVKRTEIAPIKNFVEKLLSQGYGPIVAAVTTRRPRNLISALSPDDHESEFIIQPVPGLVYSSAELLLTWIKGQDATYDTFSESLLKVASDACWPYGEMDLWFRKVLMATRVGARFNKLWFSMHVILWLAEGHEDLSEAMEIAYETVQRRHDTIVDRAIIHGGGKVVVIDPTLRTGLVLKALLAELYERGQR